LITELRARCACSDPEFVAFAEGLINGDAQNVDVEHLLV